MMPIEKQKAIECARCSYPSNKEYSMLYECGGYYLCSDCYAESKRLDNKNS